MRIVQIVDTLDAGGMEAQLVALMNRLDPEEFKFHVVCLRHPGIYAQRLREGIRLTALNKTGGFQFGVVRQVRKLFFGGCDLIHTHNWAPLVYASLASHGGLTSPILHGEHAQLNSLEVQPRRLLARRLLYRSCAAVHTVSEGQREDLLQQGLSHRRLLALANGVDTSRFVPAEDRAALRERLGLPAEALVLGIVARFGSYKRHAALLEAFEKIAAIHADAHLLIVGDGGPEKEAVTHQVQKSFFASRMTMAGYQRDPVPWYQTMDALVVPSSNEGLSNATLEAMACGVPVLSNDICGARELLGANEGGWVRDMSTVSKLSAELTELLSLSPATLQTQGKAGCQRAARLFSWDGMARSYAQIFRECARRRR